MDEKSFKDSPDSKTRREFLKIAGTVSLIYSIPHKSGQNKEDSTIKSARYYRKLPYKKVQCLLCPWQCVVREGQKGHCQVRRNIHGKYYSLVYGRVSAYHVDPIEKKPFFHFLPSTNAFSIASVGCNVDCKFCQNWEIARRGLKDVPFAKLTPEYIIKYAKISGCRSIAFTYNEPTISTEFNYDVAALAKENNIHSVVISNGFINKKPLQDLAKVIDAYKVDLKAFDQSYYTNIVHGELKPVLDTIVNLKSEGVWTEIVYLTVPTLNDDPLKIKAMARWIKNEVGPDVPVHFSRFYPRYKLKNLPPTPVATVERLRNTALDVGLNFVYIGNVPGHKGENTYCPNCGKPVIRRIGFEVIENRLKNGKCPYCGNKLPGFWEG